MASTKIVNGVTVEMTAAEETAFRAQQVADAAFIAAQVPSEVTPLQVRRALRQTGQHSAWSKYMAKQSDEAQEGWDYATRIPCDDPLIDQATKALGIDKAALFRLAATL